MRISDWSSDVCSSDLRDFNISRKGEGKKGTRYYATPRAPSHRNLSKYELHDLEEIIEAMGATPGAEDESAAKPAKKGLVKKGLVQIGRASCRERVCQYV